VSTARARLRDFLPDASELPILFAARGLACTVAWHDGFRALSDDDYARIAIAQRFAHAPSFDPSGTSWLPAPFWLYGSAFRCFGTELGVARAMAIALGLCATVLVYVAARLLGTGMLAALLGAALSCLVVNYSTLLGLAALPEVPCAALMLFSAAALARPELGLRVWGGLSLTLACLSRYEAWPVALIYVGFCAWDALRQRRPALFGAAALASVGPGLWLSLGRIEHGDALFFIARVTSYRQALGGAASSTLQRLAGYPLALLSATPELCGLLLLLWFITFRQRPIAALRLGRCALAMLAVLAFLMLGSVSDGVPTHHAARVLLPLWFFGCVLAAQLFSVVEPGRQSRAVIVVAFFALSALYLSSRVAKEGFAARSSELEAGRIARRYTSSDLAIDTPDYGYFAIQAGFGAPADTRVLEEHDPRRRAESPFRSAAALEQALRQQRARFAIVSEAHAPLLSARCKVLWQRTPFVLASCADPDPVSPGTSPP